MKRYQLRYAAGTYWLSDTNPEGSVIPRPLELNETATEIWKGRKKRYKMISSNL